MMFEIILGNSTVLCKLWDFICTSLHPAENLTDKIEIDAFKTAQNASW